MNLSPLWVQALAERGWQAIHWSTVGDSRATDAQIMAWARTSGHVVFTHDLDFGTLLALTHAMGPSVIQVRTHDVLPGHLEQIVVTAIRTYESQLRDGAIVTVDELRGKVRVLPIIRGFVS